MSIPTFVISGNRPRCWVNNADLATFQALCDVGGAWEDVYNDIKTKADALLGQSAAAVLDTGDPEHNILTLCFVGWIEANTTYYNKAIDVGIELVNAAQSGTAFVRIRRVWAQSIILDFCFNTLTGTEKLTIFGDADSTSVPSDKDDIFLGYETGFGQCAKLAIGLIAHGYDNTLRDDLFDVALPLLFGNGTLV